MDRATITSKVEAILTNLLSLSEDALASLARDEIFRNLGDGWSEVMSPTELSDALSETFGFSAPTDPPELLTLSETVAYVEKNVPAK